MKIEGVAVKTARGENFLTLRSGRSKETEYLFKRYSELENYV